MKPLPLLAVALLAATCLPAAAQFAVYGKLDLNHHHDNNSNDGYMLYGGGVGLSYTFVNAGPVKLGGDLRGDLLHGNSNNYYSVLVGLPLAVKLPATPIKPYIEPLVGVGGIKYTGNLGVGLTLLGATNHYTGELTYGLVGGIDLTVLPHVDWRVIEVGYTREKNGTLSDPNVLVSTGLGLRF